ncbi:MAG TPA: hypothetical protein VJB65_00620 [Patescibacteria group bacterium]|nr:hypothetical protein [Patescibacteria group bacterium]
MNTPKYVQDNIFVELGLANLPLERKVQMLEQMNDLVHKRVMVRMLEMLPQEAKDRLPEVENKTPQEQLEFIMQFVPDLGILVVEEVEAVKKGLLESSKSL